MLYKCFSIFSTVLVACAGTLSEDSDILPGNLDEEVEAICNSAAGCPCEGECCGPDSPIILDLSGDGFALTDAAHGVVFDLRANGRPELWAWTMASSDNAWLALDRDGDGAITSGAELFGNHTDQPQSPHPNGYLALAVFDANGDGQINAADPIYSALRLWIDANHDGVSQPNELHTLAEFGVLSLSVDYRTQARVDDNGNVFRYRSSLTRAPGSSVNHVTYDVILAKAAGTAVSRLTRGSDPRDSVGANDATNFSSIIEDVVPLNSATDGTPLLQALPQLADGWNAKATCTLTGPPLPNCRSSYTDIGQGGTKSEACESAKMHARNGIPAECHPESYNCSCSEYWTTC